MKLKDLNPCNYSDRIGSTTQQEWDKNRFEAMWLVRSAHSHGSMSRKQLISIVLKTVEPVFPLMLKESLACIHQLQKWIEGEETDLEKVRIAAEAADAAVSLDASLSVSFVACTANTAAYVANAACAAYDAAAAARIAARAVDAADIARCFARIDDVVDVRKHVTCEEVCKYLELDPNEVLK